MAIYINGTPLNDLLKKYDINIQEMEQTIDIKSAFLNIPTIENYQTTLANLSIEYTEHETIDDYIRALLKFD